MSALSLMQLVTPHLLVVATCQLASAAACISLHQAADHDTNAANKYNLLELNQLLLQILLVEECSILKACAQHSLIACSYCC